MFIGENHILAQQQSGVFELVNLADQLNAANDNNETNATTGFTKVGSGVTLTSTSTNPITGTYSILAVNTTHTAGNRLEYDITGTEIGARYRIIFKAYWTVMVTSIPRIQLWEGIETAIPVTNLSNHSEDFVFDVVATATTIVMRIDLLVQTNAIVFDSLEIYKNVPIESNPLDVPSLVSRWDETSIDVTATIEGDDINTWADTKSSNDATQTLTLRPKLHIDSVSGNRQVRFDGINDWLQVGKPANLAFVPNTDPFSIVVKIGETAPSQGYFLSKAHATASLRTYGVYGTGGNFSAIVGGTTVNSGVAVASGDIVVFVFDENGNQIFRVNGKRVQSNQLITTTYSDDDINIGGRSNGGWLVDGDIEFVAVYNTALTPYEIGDIEEIYNEN